MILNNLLNWKAYVDKNVPTNAGSYINSDLGMKDPSGNKALVLTNSPQSDYYKLITNWALKYGLSVKVGTGTTAPTAADYNMESDATGSFTNYTYTYTTGTEDGYMTTVFTVTGVNSTANPITITEIGLFKEAYTNNDHKSIMLVRELLETPKVVAAGEMFTLIITWAEGQTPAANTRSIKVVDTKSVSTESEEEPKEIEEKKEDLEKDILEEEEPGEQRKYLME